MSGGRHGDYGIATEPGTVRFERLPGPIERVWAYLTESEKRGQWFAAGKMDLRVGGTVELIFRFADLAAVPEPIPDRFKQYDGHVSGGRITRCDPPGLLNFTWADDAEPASEVTFELTPRDRDTLFVLTHRRLADRATTVNVSAGWHAHLGVLGDLLAGRPPRPFWSTLSSLEAEYDTRIPGEGRAA